MTASVLLATPTQLTSCLGYVTGLAACLVPLHRECDCVCDSPPPRPQLGVGGLLAGAGPVAPYRLHLPSGAAVRTVAAGRYPHTGQGGHPAVPPAGAQAEDIAARHWCGE